jgi:23S rRNA (adenine-N6)-dimethyltransferase
VSADPRRSVRYSQNFLRDPRLVDFLLDAASIGPDDLVYEIGPGPGVITERLARRCRRVVAIEKDPALARQARTRFAGTPTVAIQEADFLDVRLPAARYKVFASIPFNITSAILAALTETPCPPEEAYLVMQREAAEKFAGEPRTLLGALLLKPWFEPAILHHFRRADFAPAPRVDVVMLRLRKRGPPLIAPADRQLYRDFVAHAYTDRRPLVRDTFAALFGPQRWRQARQAVEIAADAGPTALRFEEWLVLFHLFKLLGDDRARSLVSGAEARLQRQQAGLERLHRTRLRETRSAR